MAYLGPVKQWDIVWTDLDEVPPRWRNESVNCQFTASYST